MKKILFILMFATSILCQAHEGGNFVASDIQKELGKGDKIALLMVHFGTTYDDTRAVTIDAINQKAKETFADLEIREAYTSRIVIRRLNERGIQKADPVSALLRLKADGYTHILVQSTNIIEGVEMESLRKDVASVKQFFKEIRVGNPLLYATEDFERVAEIFTNTYQDKKDMVLVGHGTYTPSTATYAMMDYIFKAKGHNNFHVGTVEAYPTFDNVVAQLKVGKAKQVNLLPFMFVAGDHANNDIAGDWKEDLEKEGYKVDVVMKGLGEYLEIQNIFIEHIQFIMHHRMLDIMTKKKAYAAGAEVH